MRTHSSLVGAYFGAGLYRQASQAAERALKLESAVTDDEEIASMHLNVARSLLHDGHGPAALMSLRKAEEMFASAGRAHDSAYAQLAAGIVHSKEDRLEEGRRCVLAALDLLSGEGADLDEARALNELGRIERLRGDREAAHRYLEKAITLATDADLSEQASSHRELALCMLEEDVAVAEKHARSVVDLYRRTDTRTELATALSVLADVLWESGDLEGSREAYRDALGSIEGT
jgi:tetratricopeptide (TPR) repeat protein